MQQQKTPHYEVIARRWRPKSFADIVGQEHIVRTLRNALNSGRIASAFLFVGSRGTGKTSLARIFSMALNCANGPSAEFNSEDGTCAAIWRGEDLDVLEIDGASHNSVDDVRELRDHCVYAPTKGLYRIYILDEVHMLTNAAFNALLKIIEEPPVHVKFIFATTEAAKVPSTILSRCQCFHFRQISIEDIAKKLRQIIDKENVVADNNVLLAIARFAQGSMRDAQTSLEQLITHCGQAISEEDVLGMYCIPRESEMIELETALLNKNSEKALQLAEQWYENGVDLNVALQNFQELLRQKLIAGDYDRISLQELLQTLHRWSQILPRSVSERTCFAIALLEAIENSKRRPIDKILKHLNKYNHTH